MICEIFLPTMPAILCMYCTLGREVQYSANIAHILHLWEEVQFCANLAHILCTDKKYNLVQMLRIYCALGKQALSCASDACILHIGEISTILLKSCAYIAHWGKNLVQMLRIYCASNAQLAHLAQNTISLSWS